MIAPVTGALAGGSAYKPSAQIERAAKAAADSPHALINLTRLIRGLDTRVPVTEPDDSPLVETAGTAQQRRKDGESLLYARAVLDQLKERNEGSSKAADNLQDLSSTLDAVLIRYEVMQELSCQLPSRPSSSTANLKPGPIASRTTTSDLNGARPRHTPENAKTLIASNPPTISPNTQRSAIRKRNRHAPSLSEYLSKREWDDAKGGEAGLLPLATPPTVSNGAGRLGQMNGTQRDQLLAGKRSEGVMGNSQLHDELGGQLAEMSHRLKLNAIHFANSLEAEKPLLESSQQTLESNLVATQSSKKQLGTVTRKGRGTTCLTLGVVLLVLIIFVWTYLLIRFT